MREPCGGVLAFDFGEVRIGVAQGETQIGIAHPLATVTGNSNAQKFERIAALVAQWQPQYFVVGLPVHADGTPHELTRLAQRFGERLQRRFALPVYWADERFSSLYAEELLHQARVFGKKHKQVLDQVAAQALLQWFFDGGRAGGLDGTAET
ncbi:Holliday junction resolvase RuvX [Conchiformibius kuhniae]|uniref:Putative pre-16S rRNA nuclease n=1 Tax=Conchiformibius kuhniae TaxID=211502 RepID=A0A8T9MUI2_9NEIS|nr:Holliday junction resolvase RuvX [Conchiformibius kuhniae]UOP04774.1 Holliday junction resolvase RuvX [Conchiformibius kuhniae]